MEWHGTRGIIIIDIIIIMPILCLYTLGLEKRAGWLSAKDRNITPPQHGRRTRDHLLGKEPKTGLPGHASGTSGRSQTSTLVREHGLRYRLWWPRL